LKILDWKGMALIMNYFKKESVVASYEGQKSVDFCKSIEMSRKVLK
jgi:hypothetical protein